MRPMTLISDSPGDLTVSGARAGLSETGTRSPAGLSRAALSLAQLSRLVACTAAQSGRWRDLVRYDPARRWYRRLELTGEYEVWLLSWRPGQGTGYHDHGGSRGAFAVALGELQEQTVRGRAAVTARSVAAGGVRSFGPRFVHQVVNDSAGDRKSVV